ncbi:MAG: aldo/keto reductase [Deltaproteobacteria bacterium]|nr:aldo/keto reductase [Deltaproteobacteria bacterium]
MSQDAIQLGRTGPKNVFPIGLGCMALSSSYTQTDDETGLRVLDRALERGVTLLDTGDFYGMGHNEMLIGRAIRGRDRARFQLSVKFGGQRDPSGAWVGFDTSPAAVKTSCAYSLQRLGVDYIDIYRPGRLDPRVPIEDTVGAIKDLIQAGYVRHVGLSEVGVETIRRAHAVHPVADLQIEYAVATRGPEASIFPALRELGVSATLYGVLSRGLLSGSKPTDATDYRKHLPRFTGEAGAQNAQVVERFAAFARDRGMSPAQLAYAWVLAKEPGFLPLAGARTVAQLDDTLGALDHPLSASDVAALEELVPKGAIAGDRYPTQHMAMLDSER